MIKEFVHIILGYKRRDQIGLFGNCEAYYGMVEQQGRGTLHCHMLVWLKGHPSPSLLHKNMKNDSVFAERVLKWLESIIKCELPGDSTVVCEPNQVPLPKPPISHPHPTTVPSPRTQCTHLKRLKLPTMSKLNG
jgi:hypothetical protein